MKLRFGVCIVALLGLAGCSREEPPGNGALRLSSPQATDGRLVVSVGPGAAATTRTISVAHDGTCALAYTTDRDGAWLAVSPAMGTVDVGGSVALTVTVTPGSLPVGVYEGAVIISVTCPTNTLGVANSPAAIQVFLVITAPDGGVGQDGGAGPTDAGSGGSQP